MTHHFRVFLASPGDVSTERAALPRAVDEFNLTLGPVLDCRLEAVLWESHAAPGAGRPQQLINDQIGRYDIFLGVMWRRFGTPSGAAESGTEEEYRLAYARWQREPEMPLMFYFCQQPFFPATLAELDQLRQVLLFRQEIEHQTLVWPFAAHADFETQIRQHLCKRVPNLVKAREGRAQPGALPDDGQIAVLRDIWPKLDAQTQRAINTAYRDNRMAGDAGIQTRDLFAALLGVGDAPLDQVVADIPKQALPEPNESPLAQPAHILGERPWLSGCVAASIRRLNQAVPSGHLITPVDIFTDIAKHGTGSSVALLRQHRIGPADIDAILQRKNITAMPT